MTNKEKNTIARRLMELEQECQKGNNISENLSKMNKVIEPLSIQDLIELDAYMEENFEKLNEKYLII